MTPEENVKVWESLLAGVSASASDIANAMGETFQGRVTNDTLRQTSHPPGMFWKAPPGRPPAYVTGNLARSVIRKPALGSVRATSTVAATANYAGIQEFGGYTWGHRGFMHWRNSGGSWWKRSVFVPEHPYFRPTLETVIRDGSLQRSAIAAFVKHTSPFIR